MIEIQEDENANTVTRYLTKNPGGSNGEGWAVATAPQPDRYKHIDVIKKRSVLLRAAFGRYSAQTPPPSELWVSGGTPLTTSASVCPLALFTCKAASMPCAATPLGTCFIDQTKRGKMKPDT